MKLSHYAFALLAVLLTTQSHAALISIDASADMTSIGTRVNTLLPLGTTVHLSLQFDVSSGTISTASISNVSGTFSWNDDTLGLQTFFVNDRGNRRGRNSSGILTYNFIGTGSTIDGVTASQFILQFDIGTNPFSIPGSTTPLIDLLLGSSIYQIRFGAQEGPTTTYGTLGANVSSTINAVPLPAALPLFLFSLLGLCLVGRKNKKFNLDSK